MPPRRLVPALACLLVACTGDSSGDNDDEVGTTDDDSTTTETDSGTDSDTGTETGEEGFDPYPWPDEELTTHVDPMIGTGGVGYRVGTMNPGPSLPFGMVKPGPDTGIGGVQISYLNCTGYHYEQPHIWGFSHSRINGMGVPDYGAILVTPTVGMDADKAVVGGARSLIDHADEQVSAGYYAVSFDAGIRAELTTTTRVARHRYTWDEPSAEATVTVNLAYNPAQAKSTASEVTIDPATGIIRGMMTVQGSYSDRFGGVPTYFVGRFSQPIAAHGVWNDEGELLADTATMTGAEIGAWLSFDLAGADEAVVELELAISYVSIEEAEANLAEVEGQTFDDTHAAAVEAWEAELHRVRVLGGDEQQRLLFYSALYRAFLAPTTFTDASGKYRGFDKQVHDAEGFTYYSDFSLWDTYRTLHPLLNLLQRDRHADMMQSLTKMAEQGGDLPKWPLGIGYTGGMVGTSADIVLADAYLKDITDFDVDTAYAAARLHATEPRENDGRAGIVGYWENGWVAIEDSGASASETIEFTHADYALGRWAAAMGLTDDAAMFSQSSSNWKNLWEPQLEYLIGRRADGSFPVDEFDPLVWEDYYSEGTAHHYVWAIPHDVAGLAELMGGPEALRDRLQEYFEISDEFLNGPMYNPINPVPYYWHSNEPSLHNPYLFTEVGDPASTQYWVTWARERHYGPGPEGLPGNDDAGTMSAWYVWASIGLYPLPGSDGYWITAPTFERVELDMGDATTPDRRLAIIAEGEGIYIAGATYNGVALERPWITWQQLREGGTLRLTLASEPSNFGAAGGAASRAKRVTGSR